MVKVWLQYTLTNNYAILLQFYAILLKFYRKPFFS